MVQVELSEDDWKQRAEKLASEESERISLIEKKRTHNRKWNEELIQLRDSIGQLAEEVDTRQAWVPAQASMFDGGAENDGELEAEANGEDPEPVPARRRGRGRRGAASAGATA